MIAFQGNRPVIQVGRHQVADYDDRWLFDALEQAAAAADLADMPCLEEIGRGISLYLASKCPLRMLPVSQLRERVCNLLEQVGCASIARELRPFAPPVSISLIKTARQAGIGFELAFFEQIRTEVAELKREGAASIHFTQLREAVLIIADRREWDRSCDDLLGELNQFLEALDPAPAREVTCG